MTKQELTRMAEAVAASGRYDESWRIVLKAKEILEEIETDYPNEGKTSGTPDL